MKKLSLVLIVVPLHVCVECQHPDDIVLEKDHDARNCCALLLSQLHHPDIDVTDTEWVSSRLLTIEGISILSAYIGQWLSNMAPRALLAYLCIHVANRDHIVVADDRHIIVDQKVREQLQSVLVWEQSSLLRLDLCLGYSHSV